MRMTTYLNRSWTAKQSSRLLFTSSKQKQRKKFKLKEDAQEAWKAEVEKLEN